MQLASRLLIAVTGVCVLALIACGDDAGGGAGSGAVPLGGAAAAAPATGGVGGAGVAGTPAGGATGGVSVMTGTGATPATGGMGSGAGGMTGTGGTGMMMTTPTACSAPEPNMAVGNACPGAAPPAIKLTMVTGGLVAPTFVAQAPGDPSRLYVLEQQGTIRVVKDGMLQGAPLMDLRDLAGAAAIGAGGLGIYSEAGLLGMAFDPNFETTKRFWIHYNKGPSATTSLMKFEMSNPDMVDVTTGQEVLSVPQITNYNHKGGMIAFGPDGCLFMGMGDGGNEDDSPQMTGQGTADELSVMLRIDVDKYPTAAPGNLDGNIWSTGLRNPWRFSFDRMTGDLYIGDIGQGPSNGWEEVDVEPRGVSGRNYGWSVAEGKTVCRADCSAMTKPAKDYSTTNGANSVIGGYVYRGTAIAGLAGRYVYADWTERKIKTFVYKGETGGQPEICDEFDTGVTVPEKVRSFGEDLAGELYVLSGGSGSGTSGATLSVPGTLYKIEPQ